MSSILNARHIFLHLKTSRSQCCQYAKQMPNFQASRQCWTSHKIRKTFIEYFEQRDHRVVPSSSIIAKKDDGSYFVNAGMNQFKPIFLGTVHPGSEMSTYKRVVNSQKCIRVGGKHNDLSDVGKDTSHHTFFEMLGSWSFGDYFKRDACSFAWDLLTNVYRLPADRLYVTYFQGDPDIGLAADTECQSIWQSLGVPASRVLPFGLKDNFWSMADTGPCGPCTEIHYDHLGRASAAGLVNTGSPELVEIWNLVFMQFNRLNNGRLETLPQQHVDTGLGLERLCAVLQGQVSNYNTDLFKPVIHYLNTLCPVAPYSDRYGLADHSCLDTAYRTVADHVRMVTVAISDGLLPGKADSNMKVKQVLYRCFHQAYDVLKAPPGSVGRLVSLVVQSLGDAFPEQVQRQSQVTDIINYSEKSYFAQRDQAKKAIAKFHSEGPVHTDQHVSGVDLLSICRRCGPSLMSDVVVHELRSHGFTVAEEELHQLTASQAVNDQPTPTVIDYHALKDLPPTNDQFKYNYTYDTGQYGLEPIRSTVLALVSHTGGLVEVLTEGEEGVVVLDQTNFYAEQGGQVGDEGELLSLSDSCVFKVHNVTLSPHGHVLHEGMVTKGQVQVKDNLLTEVKQLTRHSCMLNHTATHLLHLALTKVLGSCRQAGSLVSPDKLTFDFVTFKPEITPEDIHEAEKCVNTLISKNLPVFTSTVEYATAKTIPGCSALEQTDYPEFVRVLSIGCSLQKVLKSPELSLDHSVELCSGTHVKRTGDIGELVVTSVQTIAQGTKRVTALTGNHAKQVSAEGLALKEKLKQLEKKLTNSPKKEECVELLEQLTKSLGSSTIPRADRDLIQSRLDWISQSSLLKLRKSMKELIRNDLMSAINGHTSGGVTCAHLRAAQNRDVFSVLQSMEVQQPLCVVFPNAQNKKQISVVLCLPKSYGHPSISKWTENLSAQLPVKSVISQPKSTLSDSARVINMDCIQKSELDVFELARTSFAHLRTMS